jgi:hypothetical protein
LDEDGSVTLGLALDFFAAAALYVGSPMPDRFGCPEARVSEASGSPTTEVPPLLTFLRLAAGSVPPAAAAERFLGGIMTD